MTGALVLFGYAIAAAWLAPVPLAPLTSRGASARLGIAAWLAAMAGAATAAAGGLDLSIRTAAADWPRLTQTLCRSVAGGACTPQVYRSALYSAGVAAFAAAATVVAGVALWRCGRRVQRSRRRTLAHAAAARVTGRALPGTGAVVLDDLRPAAYCVAGRPAAIVLTSGALALLDQPQLAAVLAHERAHLAGRHHALLLLTRALAGVFPGVPLFGRGSGEVATLTEMAADDAAARRSGRVTVAAALLALAVGRAIPGSALPGIALPGSALPGSAVPAPAPPPAPGPAAASQAVPARVERLLSPAGTVTSAAFGAALVLALALLAAAPLVLTSLIVG